MSFKICVLFLGGVENILGKGENAGYQHFLLFQKKFSKCPFLKGRLKSGLCSKGLNGKLFVLFAIRVQDTLSIYSRNISRLSQRFCKFENNTTCDWLTVWYEVN